MGEIPQVSCSEIARAARQPLSPVRASPAMSPGHEPSDGSTWEGATHEKLTDGWVHKPTEKLGYRRWQARSEGDENEAPPERTATAKEGFAKARSDLSLRNIFFEPQRTTFMVEGRPVQVPSLFRNTLFQFLCVSFFCFVFFLVCCSDFLFSVFPLFFSRMNKRGLSDGEVSDGWFQTGGFRRMVSDGSFRRGFPTDGFRRVVSDGGGRWGFPELVAQVLVLTHEDAGLTEQLPYMAARCSPIQVVEFFGRSANRDPPCESQHCVFNWWKEPCVYVCVHVL